MSLATNGAVLKRGISHAGRFFSVRHVPCNLKWRKPSSIISSTMNNRQTGEQTLHGTTKTWKHDDGTKELKGAGHIERMYFFLFLVLGLLLHNLKDENGKSNRKLGLKRGTMKQKILNLHKNNVSECTELNFIVLHSYLIDRPPIYRLRYGTSLSSGARFSNFLPSTGEAEANVPTKAIKRLLAK